MTQHAFREASNSIASTGRAPSPLPPVPSSYQHPNYLPSAPPRSPTSPVHSPLPPETFCTATKDHDSFSYVDLSSLASAAAIRETILSKLHVPDDEFSFCTFYHTKIGSKGDGRQIRIDDLWEVCRRGGESGVTIFVKVAPSATGDDLEAGASAARGNAEREGRYRTTGSSGYSPTDRTPSATRREKAASISSRSDRSGHLSPVVDNHSFVNEFGEVGTSAGRGGQGYYSQPGHARRSSHGSTGGLSPPIDRRSGSLTPTAPEDYLRRGEEWDRPTAAMERRPSQGQPLPPPSVSTHGPQNVVVLQSGQPVRRLPGPPPQGSSQGPPSEYEPRTRTHTAPGTTGPPQLPPATAQNWSRGIPTYQNPPPLVRPLPPTDPRMYHHPPPLQHQASQQFNIVPAPNSPSPYHNMQVQALQTSFQSQPPQPTPPPLPSSLHPGMSQQQRMLTKSAGNLREHYSQAFEQEIRPPVPPQIPQPYGASHQPSYRPGQGPAYPAPPVQARPPPTRPPQQPSFAPPQSPYGTYSSTLSSTFDPRVLHSPPAPNPGPPPRPATSASNYSMSSASSSTPQWNPPLPRRQDSREAWSSSASEAAPYDLFGRLVGPGSADSPRRLPDVSGPIPLQPGQILQQQTARRPSEHLEVTSPTGSMRGVAPPPSAALMRPNDPTTRTYEQERYLSQSRRESGGSTKESEGSRRESGGSSRERIPSREGVPKSLQAGVQHPQVERARDSSSSSSSVASASTSWKQNPSPAPSAPPAAESGYAGIEDDGDVYQSPPSSARSSTSASGPLTPASAKNSLLHPSVSSPQSPNGAGEQVWPPKEPRSPTPVRKSSTHTPVLTLDPAVEDGTDSSTLHASQWTKIIADKFGPGGDSGEGEKTIPSAAASAPPSQATTPTPPALSSLTTNYDDDEDDGEEQESSTYIKGFAPPSAASPQPPSRVVLQDNPSNRSPSASRTRPPLHVDTSAVREPVPTVIPPSPHTSPLESLKSTGSDAASSANAARRADRRAREPRPPRLPNELQQPDLSPLSRRGSFLDREQVKNDWAPRPKVEDVLENLDAFFPKHDLNKPVFDAPTPTATTPSPTASPAKETPSMTPLRKLTAAGLGYKKSIRVVAGDRKRNMLKASARREASGGVLGVSSMLRRKSTKLFGSRLEEVTPAKMKQMDETILEAPPEEDSANFSFKWIKGEMIGRGSYGKVYIAFNVTAGEAIAVKQVELPRTANDKLDTRLQGMVSSLKAEIELLKDLSHDNIVEYLGMEETVEYLSIFLEYVPGGSVARIIRTHGKFPEEVIKHFTFQILRGLQYLHSVGILHRDLKGDNILCDHEGICKISDFGTSKRAQDIYNNNAEHSMQGSIFWMAPEVVHQNEQKGYSAKADIWSLGCLCLEMFAGRRPWDQSQMVATMIALGAEKRAPPVPEDVILSDTASAFFKACFQIDPDLRPRAEQLIRHRFLELDPDYSFANTSLGRAIAQTKGPSTDFRVSPQ
ncbi:mitogen-activated protein kinase kinase kinase [Pseudohyphozyma bogoriensis]|nr:mitogen-activated protein kinase kinase kinase [Pseudohyphozyma bogoriensis]